jgi:hypothetical protein
MKWGEGREWKEVQAPIYERVLNIFDTHLSAPDEKAVSRI